MKHRTLVISACALAAAAASNLARADDDSIDCSKENPAVLQQTITNFLGLPDYAASKGCTNISPVFITLIGKPTAAPCKGEEGCREGKHFIQEFQGVSDGGTGDKVTGHLAIDWHMTRVGFTEWCAETLVDCKQ